MSACSRPGDVEEWKTNTIFDEDSEVVHIEHGFAGKDKRKGWVRIKTFNMRFVIWCTKNIHMCVFVGKSHMSAASLSAGHQPSISH